MTLPDYLDEVEKREKAATPEIVECSDHCGGCSCHINPPCGHCTDGHGFPSEEASDIPLLIAIIRRQSGALEKLHEGWLYWPVKKQPDERVKMYDARTLDEILTMASNARTDVERMIRERGKG